MPKDGNLIPPTREEILINIRQQMTANLVEQIINLEADKAEFMNEITLLKRRIDELLCKVEQ